MLNTSAKLLALANTAKVELKTRCDFKVSFRNSEKVVIAMHAVAAECNGVVMQSLLEDDYLSNYFPDMVCVIRFSDAEQDVLVAAMRDENTKQYVFITDTDDIWPEELERFIRPILTAVRAVSQAGEATTMRH